MRFVETISFNCRANTAASGISIMLKILLTHSVN